ncbi:hypothetical protein LB533_20515 [Mesorhizobium sp. BR1-1-13]|uniref:hypothetical protein n=1 Tax=Mesorhizobium sp. BR1-1-13 TaxID=2876656 RepID=UPI001CD1616B|nr:hypothetical protein [Mesorhizobium sp. BR1-1-13]MBZ9943473.1 hypothetical protein [Mesorhizobium sp. BR1-1-13]
MTCIVGIVYGGKVYLGGDSAGVDGTDINVRTQSKVFRNGDFVIGYTTSFRMGNLLQHAFVPPRWHPDDDLYKFMVTDFVDAAKSCLEAGGYTAGGNFLVGYAGRLFEIQDDWQVSETIDRYMAVGCGDKYALGNLYDSKGAPKSRIIKALNAAAHCNAGVRAPFFVEMV